MNKTDVLLRVITWPIRHEVEQEVRRIAKNLSAAPICCEESMTYLGEHRSLYQTTRVYQCLKCKKVELN